MRLLLDTNIISELRKRTAKRNYEMCRAHTPQEVGTNLIVVAAAKQREGHQPDDDARVFSAPVRQAPRACCSFIVIVQCQLLRHFS